LKYAATALYSSGFIALRPKKISQYLTWLNTSLLKKELAWMEDPQDDGSDTQATSSGDSPLTT
jgi:hypothetical protein